LIYAIKLFFIGGIMAKWGILLITFLLYSCGKTSFPLTYNVPAKYYDQYKNELDLVAQDLVSKSGKHLVQFVRNENDPKYSSLPRTRYGGEFWIYFKETADQFDEVGSNTLGIAYIGSSKYPTGGVVLNFYDFSDFNSQRFRRVLDHELMHCLGFDHNSDWSVMNDLVQNSVIGTTELDDERLAIAFPFNMEPLNRKDLEKIGALMESQRLEILATNLMENFSLSETRALEVSKHVMAFQRVSGMRELTPFERDLFTKQILGFGYEKGKAAFDKYMQGDQEELDNLIQVAADKNETTPENIKEIMGQLLLK
jgi:hypothetical protein